LIGLDDYFTIIQLISAFLAGSGAASLFIVWYEQRERRREKAVDRFLDRVLTRDYFSFESFIWDLCNLYRAHDKLKEGGSTACILQGFLVPIRDETEWHRTMTGLLLKFPVVHKRLEDTGVISLAPKKIRNRVTDIALKMGQFGKRIEARQDVSELAKEVENQLKQLSEDVRGIIGTFDL